MDVDTLYQNFDGFPTIDVPDVPREAVGPYL